MIQMSIHTGLHTPSSTYRTLSGHPSQVDVDKTEVHNSQPIRGGPGTDLRDSLGESFLNHVPDAFYSPSEHPNADDPELHGHGVEHGNATVTYLPSPPLSAYGMDQIPLQNRLLSILRKIPGHEEKKGFFPENELTQLMTEENVTKELQLCFEDLDSTTIATFTHKICGTIPNRAEERPSFKKVFAILVLCEKPNAIPRFLEEGVSDGDLPLHKLAALDNSPNIYNLSRKQEKTKLKCFSGWSYTAVWRFEEWQWTTIAPFFQRASRNDVKHLALQDQAALPFTQDSRFTYDTPTYERLEFEGGFSNVFKVDIHPDHHGFCQSRVGCNTNGQQARYM